MSNSTIELGDIARDTITGFQGVVVGTYKWIHGCERLYLQPRELKDGKPLEAVSFDRPQLELISKAAVTTTSDKGGPRPDPARSPGPVRPPRIP